jgi:hypothetical protein
MYKNCPNGGGSLVPEKKKQKNSKWWWPRAIAGRIGILFIMETKSHH